jgi:anti-anti-sigma regulatory factor
MPNDLHPTSASATPTPSADVGVTVTATSRQVVIAVWGEIDVAAVLMLDSVFDTAMALGQAPVIVDLSDLDDTIVTGLVVIATAARRFADSGGQLTLRSSLHVAGRISPWSDPHRGCASNRLLPTVLGQIRSSDGLEIRTSGPPLDGSDRTVPHDTRTEGIGCGSNRVSPAGSGNVGRVRPSQPGRRYRYRLSSGGHDAIRHATRCPREHPGGLRRLIMDE